MKIAKIENKNTIYTITYEPNWFEKLIGIKTKSENYYETDHEYVLTKDTVFLDKDGKKLGVHNNLTYILNDFERKLKYVDGK